MRNVRGFSKVLLAGALCVSMGAAQSQSVTDTFLVQISIQGTCTALTATDINFGTQVPSAGTHSQTGTIQLQCTKDLPFQLALNGGSTTGSVTARAMKKTDGTQQIPYTLRRESATGPNWGDTAGTWYVGSGNGLGTSFQIPITVYAEATLTGNEPAGTYQDTVMATLTY